MTLSAPPSEVHVSCPSPQSLDDEHAGDLGRGAFALVDSRRASRRLPCAPGGLSPPRPVAPATGSHYAFFIKSSKEAPAPSSLKTCLRGVELTGDPAGLRRPSAS